MTSSAVPPIFMFGFDRSGTTLLSMMVGCHPEIAVPLSTTGMWYDLADEVTLDLKTKQGAESVVDRILSHERIQLWDQHLDKHALLDNVTPDDFGSVITAFHAEYTLRCHKSNWASMDIATLDNMHRVNRWLPNARFVHLVRDGRDVALSHQTYRYGFGNIAECAQKWDTRVTQNLRMGAMLDNDRYLVIRYEDLISETETTLRQICLFIGVDYAPEMLEYEKAVDRKVPDEKRFLWPALGQPPDKSKVDRWRAEMTTSQRIVFEQRAGHLLQELSYECFDKPPKSVSSLLLETWYCLDQGHRMKRIRNRFKALSPFAKKQ